MLTSRHLACVLVALSAGVQRMVRSDLGSAGVIFTLDTETGFRDVVLVNGSWGLGETVVQGTVVPDEWVVFKPTLRTGHRPILRRTVGSKETKLVTDPGGKASLAFGTRGQPETFAISPDGVIVGYQFGPSSVDDLEQLLSAARGGGG